MTGNDYQKLAMRTNDRKGTERLERALGINAPECFEKIADIGGLLNGCLGLSGEVGEFNDMIKSGYSTKSHLTLNTQRKNAEIVFGIWQ